VVGRSSAVVVPCGLFGVVAAALLLGCPPARAATVGVTSGTLSYTAAAGEANEVKVEVVGSAYEFTPLAFPPPVLDAQAPCSPLPEGRATCPTSGVTRMTVVLGDGDDRLLATAFVEADAARVMVPVTADGGAGNDTLAGGFADDVLNGGAGDDTLTKGYISSATLSVPADGDTFNGGDGSDAVDYHDGVTFEGVTETVSMTMDGLANDGRPGAHDRIGTDVEVAIGSDGADTLTGSPGADTLEGGGGPDVISGGGGSDTLDGFFLDSTGGGVGGDTLDGGEGADRLSNAFREHGGPGNDRLVQSADDTADGYLHGDEDDDVLLPAGYGTGADVISGDGGADTVDYSRDWNGVTVTLDGLANDSGADNVSTEVLVGGSGPDRLSGGASADTLRGGDGDDVLEGAGGTDVFSGGTGRDMVSYASYVTPLNLTLDGVANDGATGENENASGDGDVEGLEGGSAADVLAAGATGASLLGGGGDDSLTGSPGQDSLRGGPGNDTLVGLDEFDGLSGDEGNDLLYGGGGMDWLFGGSGADALHGASGADILAGNAGDDLLDPGADADSDDLNGGNWPPDIGPVDDGNDVADFSWRTQPLDVALPDTATGIAVGEDGLRSVEGILGGSGDDILTGNSRRSVLVGGAGDDILNGADGDDALDGGPGDDGLAGGSGNDVLAGDAGTDTARYDTTGLPVEATLDGEANDGPAGESDNVGPDGDVENIVGGNGDDALVGDNGPNSLDGGAAGDDLLAGLGGADHLVGSAGYDVAAYLERTQPVVLADDGTPNSGNAQDGPPGFRDTIARDVEDLWGGAGKDRLTGNAQDNLLSGGPGADVLLGGPGADAADWSERSSGIQAAIDGQPDSGGSADGPVGARDTVGTDIEALIGGDGPDRLTGSAAENLLVGLAGDDLLVTRDSSADDADCGAGRDTAVVDDQDLTAECEAVDGPPDGLAPPPAAPAVRPKAAAELTVPRGQTLRSVLRHGLRTRVLCRAACSLTQTLAISRGLARHWHIAASRRVVIARVKKRARGGTAVRVVLRVPPRIARRLRRVHNLRAVLTTSVRPSTGGQVTLTRKLRLGARVTAALSRSRRLRAIRPDTLVLLTHRSRRAG
jgi:Ca2+-binding RTX toxin-like protein